jgi:hypothetical protein
MILSSQNKKQFKKDSIEEMIHERALKEETNGVDMER